MPDHLTRITQLGAVNAFLVREDDGLTLVDTLIRGGHKRILAAAEAAGAPIVRIVLTHYHDDHSGSLDALAGALPDAERLWSEREAPILAGDTSTRPGEPGGKIRAIKPRRSKATRELSPGDRVGSLEVVPAPGHSPGQIALIDTRDRTLIAGDAYSTLGGVATTAGPYWRFPLPGLVTWDGPLALESARALRALEPSRLAVGHGKTVDDPVAAMDAAIARSES
jgi:glyoxylase-like metal-dependent hydrolase (beta-lactamase superfamily II)